MRPPTPAACSWNGRPTRAGSPKACSPHRPSKRRSRALGELRRIRSDHEALGRREHAARRQNAPRPRPKWTLRRVRLPPRHHRMDARRHAVPSRRRRERPATEGCDTSRPKARSTTTAMSRCRPGTRSICSCVAKRLVARTADPPAGGHRLLREARPAQITLSGDGDTLLVGDPECEANGYQDVGSWTCIHTRSTAGRPRSRLSRRNRRRLDSATWSRCPTTARPPRSRGPGRGLAAFQAARGSSNTMRRDGSRAHA